MKCSYCSSDIKKGTGIMYVYNNDVIKYYCASRCYRNDVIVKRKFNKKETRQKKPINGRK